MYVYIYNNGKEKWNNKVKIQTVVVISQEKREK